MPDTNKAAQAVHLLATISRLGLKAFSTKSRQALIFLMLNDTIQVIRYNRAVLWSFDRQGHHLLGISGEATPNKQSELTKILSNVIDSIEDLKEPTILTDEQLGDYQRLKIKPQASVVWLPIMVQDELKLGLWLERWDGPTWQFDEIEILTFLMQNYGAAWDKFDQRRLFVPTFSRTKAIAIGAVFLLLLLIRVPLRVVAPCEVVPSNPILITAPLEGIIEEIEVEPGQFVHEGDVLFQYDSRLPEEDLKLAEKQVQIAQAEIDKASALAHIDPEALSSLSVLQLKLKKERNLLNLARYKHGQLNVKAPINGTVIIEDPDEWRGNPVKIGEKVMMLSDPKDTKVKIWIPESDNIELNPEEHVKVILNVQPDKTYQAQLIYISSYSTLTDKSVPSFIAEANWIGNHNDTKLGLKGTAILYGENVSVLYWMTRRPWTYLRHTMGW